MVVSLRSSYSPIILWLDPQLIATENSSSPIIWDLFLDSILKGPKDSGMWTLQNLFSVLTGIFVTLEPGPWSLVPDFFSFWLQQDLGYDNKNQGVNSRHGSLENQNGSGDKMRVLLWTARFRTTTLLRPCRHLSVFIWKSNFYLRIASVHLYQMKTINESGTFRKRFSEWNLLKTQFSRVRVDRRKRYFSKTLRTH